MRQNTTNMPKPGPQKGTTAEDVLQYMKGHDRTGWSAPDLAEHLGVSRPTVKDRLDTLVERDDVVTIQVGQATAYLTSDPFDSDSEQQPEDREEEIFYSIQQAFNNRFLGTEKVWPTNNFAYTDVKEGDEIQLRIKGNLHGWEETAYYHEQSRREELDYEEEKPGYVQALVTVALVSEPTTPIEHFAYDRHTDLEDWAEAKPGLFEPSNEAYFVCAPRIDDLSPKGEGEDIMRRAATGEFSEELDSVDKELLDSVQDSTDG